MYHHQNFKLYNFHNYFLSLCNLVKKSEIPNSIIIDGMDGIGKRTFATHFINYTFSLNEKEPYNIKNYEINAMNRSYKLVLNNSHPNLYSINLNDGKSSISIEQIREMIKFANKSSFNNHYKIILINKSEFLNKSSSNAILKILEEPSQNTIFLILQNSIKKNLKTIQSRCIKFHLKLDFNNAISTTNKILNDDIYKYINPDLISHYNTPGLIINLLDFSKTNDLNLKTISINEFISLVINKKLYLKNIFMKTNFNSFLEKYLLKLAIDKKKNKYFELYDQFINMSNQTTLFNLDQESLYLNYKNNVLNG
ncbi:MAG: DNA polymerase III [Candidatus Pelagibacter sp.]